MVVDLKATHSSFSRAAHQVRRDGLNVADEAMRSSFAWTTCPRSS